MKSAWKSNSHQLFSLNPIILCLNVGSYFHLLYTFCCTLRFKLRLLQPTWYPLDIVAHQDQVDQRFGQEGWNQVEVIMGQVNRLQVSAEEEGQCVLLCWRRYWWYDCRTLADFYPTCGWTKPSRRSGSRPACCVWGKLCSGSQSDWKQSLRFPQSGCSPDTAPENQ